MKYTIKVEIAVYESEGELDDLFRTHISTVAPNEETARAFGIRIDEALRAIIMRSTKPKDEALAIPPQINATIVR